MGQERHNNSTCATPGALNGALRAYPALPAPTFIFITGLILFRYSPPISTWHSYSRLNLALHIKSLTHA